MSLSNKINEAALLFKSVGLLRLFSFFVIVEQRARENYESENKNSKTQNELEQEKIESVESHKAYTQGNESEIRFHGDKT